MEKYLPVLKRTRLFSGVGEEELPAMLNCLGAVVRSYRKGEYVFRAGEFLDSITVLGEGKLLIQKDDYWGNRSILNVIEPGELFGEAYAAPDSGALRNDVLAVEDSAVVFCVAVLVMIVASLSIVGTLVMVIIDKREDILTLRMMGARHNFVRGIFVAEGRLMSLSSLAIGLVLGAGLALLQQHFGFVGIEAETLQVSAYPVEVHLLDVLLTVVAYLAVSYLVVNLTVRALLRENN